MSKKLITEERVMKAAKILADHYGGSPDEYTTLARRMLVEVAKKKGLVERKTITWEELQKKTGMSKEELKKSIDAFYEKHFGTNDE